MMVPQPACQESGLQPQCAPRIPPLPTPLLAPVPAPCPLGSLQLQPEGTVKMSSSQGPFWGLSRQPRDLAGHLLWTRMPLSPALSSHVLSAITLLEGHPLGARGSASTGCPQTSRTPGSGRSAAVQVRERAGPATALASSQACCPSHHLHPTRSPLHSPLSARLLCSGCLAHLDTRTGTNQAAGALPVWTSGLTEPVEGRGQANGRQNHREAWGLCAGCRVSDPLWPLAWSVAVSHQDAGPGRGGWSVFCCCSPSLCDSPESGALGPHH